MRATDEQVRRLREEMSRHGKIGKAAMRSGMSENTARKYVCCQRRVIDPFIVLELTHLRPFRWSCSALPQGAREGPMGPSRAHLVCSLSCPSFEPVL